MPHLAAFGWHARALMMRRRARRNDAHNRALTWRLNQPPRGDPESRDAHNLRMLNAMQNFAARPCARPATPACGPGAHPGRATTPARRDAAGAARAAQQEACLPLRLQQRWSARVPGQTLCALASSSMCTLPDSQPCLRQSAPAMTAAAARLEPALAGLRPLRLACHEAPAVAMATAPTPLPCRGVEEHASGKGTGGPGDGGAPVKLYWAPVPPTRAWGRIRTPARFARWFAILNYGDFDFAAAGGVGASVAPPGPN
jgi:hypothetical protein